LEISINIFFDDSLVKINNGMKKINKISNVFDSAFITTSRIECCGEEERQKNILLGIDSAFTTLAFS
jgi:hypothetical protein